jgi:NDP-sugar pyrophosphorylase family protein
LRAVRSLIKSGLIYIAKIIGKKFFDEKYLKGKYFENESTGWIWVIKGLFFQKIVGINKSVPWPVAPTILINNWKNIHFNPDDLHIFQTGGTYFQAQDADLIIGKGSYIAPNVGLITTNHNVYKIEEHLEGKNINIGDRCWIGMNAVILPGVEIGAHTIVAAGAVVTKSFPEGNNILGGVPARIIKKLDKEKFV